MHCIGGFVVSLFYGLPRPTADVDYFAVLPDGYVDDLQALAGPDSMLAKKRKLHLHHFPAISLPEDYETGSRRCTPVGSKTCTFTPPTHTT